MLEQASFRVRCLAIEKLIFGIGFAIRFILDRPKQMFKSNETCKQKGKRRAGSRAVPPKKESVPEASFEQVTWSFASTKKSSASRRGGNPVDGLPLGFTGKMKLRFVPTQAISGR